MKVLIIENFPAPYRVDLYNLLSKECDLTVMYGVEYDKIRDKSWKNEDIQYHHIFTGGVRIGTTGNFSWKYKKIIKEGNFDCILVGMYSSPMAIFAMKYMKKRGIPFILNADGGFIHRGEPKLLFKLKKWIMSLPTMFITTGKESFDYFEYYGAPREKIYQYPFAFNFAKERVLPTKEDKIKLKAELKMLEKRAILCVASLSTAKGQDVLLKACEGLEDVGIYLAGGGETQFLKDLIEEHHIKNVHFLGFLNKEELSKYYMASDLFVLPTKTDVWGLVINEAMIKGLPVITTKQCNAGLGLIEEDLNGYLIEVGDVEGLKRKIINIIFDQNKLEQLSIKTYEKMKDFNIETNAKQHLEIFRNFIGKKSL